MKGPKLHAYQASPLRNHSFVYGSRGDKPNRFPLAQDMHVTPSPSPRPPSIKLVSFPIKSRPRGHLYSQLFCSSFGS